MFAWREQGEGWHLGRHKFRALNHEASCVYCRRVSLNIHRELLKDFRRERVMNHISVLGRGLGDNVKAWLEYRKSLETITVISLSNREVLNEYMHRGSGHIPKILKRKVRRKGKGIMMPLR